MRRQGLKQGRDADESLNWPELVRLTAPAPEFLRSGMFWWFVGRRHQGWLGQSQEVESSIRSTVARRATTVAAYRDTRGRYEAAAGYSWIQSTSRPWP